MCFVLADLDVICAETVLNPMQLVVDETSPSGQSEEMLTWMVTVRSEDLLILPQGYHEKWTPVRNRPPWLEVHFSRGNQPIRNRPHPYCLSLSCLIFYLCAKSLICCLSQQQNSYTVKTKGVVSGHRISFRK